MSVSDAGAPEGAPENATAEQTAESATQVSDAPWAADLRGLGLDDETFTKVDGYMREKVQPHTTQLEQSVSELREAVPEGLQRFWADLGEDPDTALTALASQVYSDNPEAEEIFKVAVKYATENPGASDEQVVQAATEHVEAGGTAQEFEVELDPEDRERLNFVDEQIAREEDKAFREDLTQLQAANPDAFPKDEEGNPVWGAEELVQVLAPFVVAAPEDLNDDEALAHAFNEYKEAAALIRSAAPGTEGAAAEAAASLSSEQIAAINAQAGGPPVLTGGQNASVPAEKKYESIGEAVADFGAELAARNAAPPVV